MSRFSRVLAAALLLAAGATWSPALLAQKKGEPKPDPAAQAEAADVQAATRAADAAMGGQVQSDFPIQFHNDFLRGQEQRVWIPFTIGIDPAKFSGPAFVYIRATPRGMTSPLQTPAPAAPEKNGKDKKDKKADAKAALPQPQEPMYPWVDWWSADVVAGSEPAFLTHGLMLPSGSYDFYVVVRQRSAAGAAAAAAAPKTAVLKQPLDVPNYATEFAASSAILANRLEQLSAPLPQDKQKEEPYVLGQAKIIVQPDRKFRKSQELIVLIQAYNFMVSPERKFNLEATYTFYRQTAEGEKRFNSTEPQTLSSESMGALDPNGDRNLQTGQGIPLQSFPEGNYRLEVKLTDKLSAKVLTQNVNFTVTS